METLLNNLNPPQREAVMTTEGPLLVLAGAGSGKTRALTHRIAYLIGEKGVRPWNILAITFTNKAAGEMRNRVAALTGTNDVFVSTFHAACVRILRSAADRLGYESGFSIYDTDDSRTLLRQILKALDYDPKQYREREMQAKISSLKNRLVTPDAFEKEALGNYRDGKIAALYREYQKRLMAANAMDFDDLLVNTVKLFEENPDVLERCRQRFKYILVDEYQDTNEAQFRMIKLLAERHGNICVVGDDDQSIYRFRGADIRNILHFEEAFPGAKVIRLEQNYRSTKTILKAANAVIANNEGRKEKTLWTDNPEGEKIAFRLYGTPEEEAKGILQDILREKKRYPYGSCAVLYRTNAQSRVLEEVFVRAGVPYRLIGGVSFYQRREIKDLIAYLKTVSNGLDDVAARRIINVPRRGIGDVTVERIADLAAQRGLSFYDAAALTASGMAGIKAPAGLLKFVSLIEKLRELLQSCTLQQLIEQAVLLSDYEEDLKNDDPIEAETRRENIRELENKAMSFPAEETPAATLARFLEDVALVSDVDSLTDESDRVVLMTLHGAKGLEFPKVYMAGMEDSLFPGERSIASADREELEEERRLCYVGITRAREKLVLTAARCRRINKDFVNSDVSRFVNEIPPELLQESGTRGGFGAAAEHPRDRFGGQGRSFTDGYGSRYAGGPYGSSQPFAPIGGFSRKPASPRGWLDFGSSPFFTPDKPARPAPAPSVPDGDAPAPVDPAELREGDRVVHKRFGAATVEKVEKTDRDYKLTLQFDTAGRKTILAAFAGLIREEDAR